MNVHQNGKPNEASSFVDRLNGAIRENPVSAGLIGLGILWMCFERTPIASLSDALTGATSQLTEGVRTASHGAGAVVARAVGTMDETVERAKEAIKIDAPESAPTDPTTKVHPPRAAAELGREIGDSVQKNVASTFETQPLLLGVIGVGVGVGIASMFSSTAIEQEFAGAAAAKVKDQLHDITSQAGQRAQKVMEDVTREATEQGLTAASASENLKNVAEKLRATATATKESISANIP